MGIIDRRKVITQAHQHRSRCLKPTRCLQPTLCPRDLLPELPRTRKINVKKRNQLHLEDKARDKVVVALTLTTSDRDLLTRVWAHRGTSSTSIQAISLPQWLCEWLQILR